MNKQNIPFMTFGMIFWLIIAVLNVCFWIFTLFYIKRGIFMTNKEKDKWFRMVVSGDPFALYFFWTKGRKKRIC